MLTAEALRAAGRHDRASFHQTGWLTSNGVKMIERRLRQLPRPPAPLPKAL